MTNGNAPKKTLEEILAEMIASSDEPDPPRYDETALKKVKNLLAEMTQNSSRLLTLCREEMELLEREPYLIHGSYPRQSFVEKVAAALVEIEELLYFNSNVTVYDDYQIRQYFHSHRRKSTEPVAIHISEERIIVRMPYLPAKYKSAKDLCNQLLAAKIYHTKNFPSWSYWHASYYHVFPSATADIPKDVDNYSYKRTNDILAFALGSCDNARRFTMSMATIFTDKIEPGTYIEITPNSSNFGDFFITSLGVFNEP